MSEQGIASMVAQHGRLWAMCPDSFRALADSLPPSTGGISAGNGRFSPPERQRPDTVAYLPLFGPIFPRSSWISAFFGGTALDHWVATLSELVGMRSVKAVVIHVDSPGGAVGGVPEAAAAVRRAARSKPILAVAETAASAAYWIASQASKLIAAPSAQVGSIGVFCTHVDLSEAARREGVTVTYVYSSPYKVEGAPYLPLSKDAKADIQARVNSIHNDFVADVARGRSVTPGRVNDHFGKGRVVLARTATQLGMADGVGEIQDAIRSPDMFLTPRSYQARVAIDFEDSEELERELWADVERARIRLHGVM
jgi:signal peptide peptidase SppA